MRLLLCLTSRMDPTYFSHYLHLWISWWCKCPEEKKGGSYRWLLQVSCVDWQLA